MNVLQKDKVFDSLPDFTNDWPREVETTVDTLIVLDDDPTGTQTVNDIPVLTAWDIAILTEELQKKTPLFYVLTNSRSLTEEETIRLHKVLADNLLKASRITNRSFQVISRSDSTLRGHFRAETRSLGEMLFSGSFLTILIPAFFEGGRFTLNNVHYVEENGELIPAATTPFAEDRAFGYAHSNLYDWICEKDPTISKSEIFDLSIEELRTNGFDEVVQKLINNANKEVLIVNACENRDLERFTIALKAAICRNSFEVLFRTAASIIPVLGKVNRRPMLAGHELLEKNRPGLIVVGSYVPKTSAQLSTLLTDSSVEGIEIVAEKLLGSSRRDEIEQKSTQIDDLIKKGRDVVTYTTRKLIASENKEESMKIINAISSGVVSIVAGLKERPGFIITKGGITSSDVATKGLSVKRALVLGQILPGIPVWKTGNESKFPDLTFVVFPGNVGSESALLDVFHKLKEAQ